jgi:hypothetical protein
MLNASLQSTATAAVDPGSNMLSTALGWNGTTLVYLVGSSTNQPVAYRYNSSLMMSMGVGVPLPLTDTTDAAAVAPTSSGFLAVASGYDTTFTVQGVYALPLDATGKPTGAAATLLSNSVRPEQSPVVAASASGFVAAVSAYNSAIEIGTLTADGVPDTTKKPVAITDQHYNLQTPEDVATGPSGAIVLWGSTYVSFSLYGANGTLGGAQPVQSAMLTISGSLANAAATWNGSAWTIVAGGYLEGVTIAADGTVSGPAVFTTPFSDQRGYADRLDLSTLGGNDAARLGHRLRQGSQAVGNHVRGA